MVNVGFIACTYAVSITMPSFFFLWLKALGIDNILGFEWLHHHHLNQWSKLFKYCIHLEFLMVMQNLLRQ
ncbi:hypothetical protein HanPI659440_Chr07g0269451 [Helianthus annuus]|nr:hypothetical protein HanPI659440_Chr07g0269451 [Helianthus annuus]